MGFFDSIGDTFTKIGGGFVNGLEKVGGGVVGIFEKVGGGAFDIIKKQYERLNRIQDRVEDAGGNLLDGATGIVKSLGNPLVLILAIGGVIVVVSLLKK